eukprot:TRINITY_DN3890_c0_g3_i1.p1 TRINITY_DN3890_c0_g3~~TRINITY_DN3890_c0_g3_i1.p1  ORF type:complete len:133 (-),score=15.31 TRINITY_DN3890_c0_g3_i1:306-704(-)
MYWMMIFFFFFLVLVFISLCAYPFLGRNMIREGNVGGGTTTEKERRGKKNVDYSGFLFERFNFLHSFFFLFPSSSSWVQLSIPKFRSESLSSLKQTVILAGILFYSKISVVNEKKKEEKEEEEEEEIKKKKT